MIYIGSVRYHLLGPISGLRLKVESDILYIFFVKLIDNDRCPATSNNLSVIKYFEFFSLNPFLDMGSVEDICGMGSLVRAVGNRA